MSQEKAPKTATCVHCRERIALDPKTGKWYHTPKGSEGARGQDHVATR